VDIAHLSPGRDALYPANGGGGSDFGTLGRLADSTSGTTGQFKIAVRALD
jgi:hypothetical protein